MVAHPDLDVEVAGRSAPLSGLAFAADPDAIAGVDPRRDLDRQGLLPPHLAPAAAVTARIGDDGTRPATAGTGLLDGKEPLLNAHLPLAGTGGTGRGGRARSRTGAGAALAGTLGGEADARGRSRHRFLESELQLEAQVGAAIDTLPTAATAEDVAEHLVEDVAKPRAAREPRAAGVHPGMAELIVGRPLLLVGENVVGFLRLLELLFRPAVVGIPIGMKLHRLTAICLLEIGVSGVARNAQHVVVVPFRHASPLPAVQRIPKRRLTPCTHGTECTFPFPCIHPRERSSIGTRRTASAGPVHRICRVEAFACCLEARRPGGTASAQRLSSRTSSNSASTTSSASAAPVPAPALPPPPAAGPSPPSCDFW